MNYSTGENDYPSNSHKSQETETTTPKKEVTSVVSGNVTKSKRKSLSHALTDIFMKYDLESIKDYVVDEVVKPLIKDGIYSVVSNGLSMFLYGTPAAGSRVFGRASSSSSKASLGKLDYTSYSKRSSESELRRPARSSVYDYETLYFESMSDADKVLIQLFDIFEEYHMVSVADLYLASGESSTPSDNDWGWDNLDTRNTYVVKDGREYYIHLPRIKPLK